MANVNVFELEGCLESLVRFQDKHPNKPYVIDNGAEVRAFLGELRSSSSGLGDQYGEWRAELVNQVHTRKKLTLLAKKIYQDLEEEGATGYPRARADYFDHEAVVAAGRALADYLRRNQQAFPFAEGALAEIGSLLDALSADPTGSREREVFRRSSMSHKRTMDAAQRLVGLMLDHIRSDFGEEGEEYRSIPWPAALAGLS